MRGHRRGVAPRHDKPGALALLGADRAEDIGPLGALVVRGARPGSTPGPAAGDGVLLPDAGFVLPPQLYFGSGREPLADLVQFGRKVFLKASIASSFCAKWRGRAEILRYPSARNSRPTVVSLSEMPNSSQIQCARSPAATAPPREWPGSGRARRYRPRPDAARHRAWSVARRLAVDQPGGTPGVEAQNPVADGLQPDPADPRRIGAGPPVADLRKREKPARLRRVLRALREPSQSRPVEIIPKRNRSSHGEPPYGPPHKFRFSRPWEIPPAPGFLETSHTAYLSRRRC